MERVEVVGVNTFVLHTKQLGPNCWCCDMYERHDNTAADLLCSKILARAKSKPSRWR